METIKLTIQILTTFLGSVAALMSITLFLRLRWPAPVLWILKLYTSALSILLGLIGLLSVAVGLTSGLLFLSMIGIYDVLIFSMHIFRVIHPADIASGFEHALPKQKNRFVPILETTPNPHVEQDIAFSRVPDTDRELLCDIWQPNENVARSGVAFVYLHGGAWYLLDKDLGTRPFFNKLASHGHVIMDVAYRLAPEADIMGMVHDVKRAIVWMKRNASAYGVDPDRIIVGGGSAGAHLALLAAYTSNNPMFTPKELEGEDMSVCGVISMYGPTDLITTYFHTNQHLTTCLTHGTPKNVILTEMPPIFAKMMGKTFHRLGFDKNIENAGGLAPLLGGLPDKYPKTYALFSPVTHVDSDCPPTLLIHGEHDVLAPVNSTRFMNTRLKENGVPTAMHIFPQTDHAFDLVLPKISPSARNAFFDVERFIEIMALKKTEKMEQLLPA